MKIRTKKVLSLLLAASMVFSMNTIAFGDEIVAEEAVVTDVADTAAATNASVNDGITFDTTTKKAITKITFAENKSDKKKSNLAKITDTTNPLSWNNFNGADLIATVLFGDANSDTYLNNKEKLGVSSSGWNYTADIGGDTYDLPDGLVYADTEDWEYRTYDLKKDDAYLLLGYALSGKTFVKGSDKFADEKYIPLEATATTDRVLKTPVTTWDGRNVDFAKDGNFKATKSKRNVINVYASVVQYKDNTVTELPGVSVKSIKISGSKKNASVTYATSAAKVTGKTTAGEVEIDINERSVIGKSLPSFKVTVNAKNDAKKFKKAIKSALKDEKFEFGIVQKAVVVQDPTYNNDIYNYAVTEGHNVKTAADAKDASANDADELTKRVAESYLTGGYSGDVSIAEWDSGSSITTGKFKKNKPVLANQVTLRDKKGNKTKDANITLKEGEKKKNYIVKEGKLATDQKVYYIDFPENGNMVYAKYQPTGTAGNYSTTSEDLSAFGYKWAFRKTKDKQWRYGIYALDNVGFVFNAK